MIEGSVAVRGFFGAGEGGEGGHDGRRHKGNVGEEEAGGAAVLRSTENVSYSTFDCNVTAEGANAIVSGATKSIHLRHPALDF